MATLLSLTLSGQAAWAQDGVDDLAPNDMAADDSAADALAADAARSDAPAGADSASGKEEEPEVPDDPAVLAVLESHPKTPAELLRAIVLLTDMGHPKLAKAFVDSLVAAKLDPQAKAALVARFNTATLIRLANNTELKPVLGPLLDDWLKAAQGYRRDPARLSQWAKQLSNPDLNEQARAMQALIAARSAAVAPLVTILADPRQSATWPVAKHLLVQLGADAVPALLGVLESPDAALKTHVVEVLGEIDSPQAVASLLAPLVSQQSTPQLRDAAARALAQLGGVPDRSEAVRLLRYAARRKLNETRQPEGGVLQHEVWHWNAQQRASVAGPYDATGVVLEEAVRLAKQLHELDPWVASYRRLYLIALLQRAQLRAGLDKPLPQGAKSAHAAVTSQGAAIVESVLAEALEGGYVPAAIAAARILGEIGSQANISRGPTSTPLVRAAEHPDHHLRFTAIDAVLRLQPAAPFAGSSYVTEGLGYFARAVGAPRVLVVHPRADDASRIAGLAMGLGYEADIATNGRDAFELAVQSPDYEFALVHSAIDNVAVDDLVGQLRKDPRTSLLAIGLMSPVDDQERVGRYARGVPRTEMFLVPQREPEFQIFAERLVALSGRSLVSPEARKAQAAAALDWIVKLSGHHGGVFDVLLLEPAVQSSLFVPGATEQAVAALAQLGTASSQRSLVDIAGLAAQPLDVRKAAAKAFAKSVRRFGILLTSQEISAQYDIYNSNAGRNADTHEVLTSLLDVMEQRRDVSMNQ